MRIAIALLAAGLSVSTPAVAQVDTGAYAASSSYVGDPLAWAYGGETRLQERTRVLNRVREVCSSRSYADKVRCGNALAIIKAGYAELQTRRAAESAIAE